MLHRPADHQILVFRTVVLRLLELHLLAIVGCPVKQLQAEIHLRQGSKLPKAGNANLCSSVRLRRGLVLDLRLDTIGCGRDRHRSALLIKRKRARARHSSKHSTYAESYSKSSHVYPAMPSSTHMI